MVASGADAAKEVFRSLRSRPGSVPLKGLGDEAVEQSVQEGPDRPKAGYVLTRRGALIAGIGDDEFALDAAKAPDELARVKLSKEQKVQKLGDWVAAKAKK
jgi:hypothetical protein